MNPKRSPIGRLFRTALCGTAIALALPVSSGAAQENAKWFVLRHDQSGACWTGMLIEVDGAYRHEFAQTAGGPYDTKDEALKREAELEDEAVCTKSQ